MIFQIFAQDFVLVVQHFVQGLEFVVELLVDLLVFGVQGLLVVLPRLNYGFKFPAFRGDALLHLVEVGAEDLLGALLQGEHLVPMLVFVFFQALGALKHIFVILFVAIVAKILQIVSTVHPAFNLNSIVYHTAIVADN